MGILPIRGGAERRCCLLSEWLANTGVPMAVLWSRTAHPHESALLSRRTRPSRDSSGASLSRMRGKFAALEMLGKSRVMA